MWYLSTTPFGSSGSSQLTITERGDLMAAFTPLGGPGTINKKKVGIL